MAEFLRLLAGTVTLRPYVFAFFAAYLFLAVTRIGWRRTALFSVIAYLIAFVCEWNSVYGWNGFPFGEYVYIPTTKNQELWVFGVPFMDSLSFTFLSYVSWEMAIVMRSRLVFRGFDVQLQPDARVRASWLTTILAGILMMYLDIVIDPVALQGKRWFLGELYYYPHGGSYFGITIANFMGWFVVCVLILRVYLVCETLVRNKIEQGTWEYPFKGLSPAGLYFGVLGFNVTMTYLIGEKTMGWASTFITGTLFVVLANHIANEKQRSR
ncbi:MAG: carotenoid biosynthesis protein [Blastocatellia bacterium]|nr:carotenoid biosynthesis protein [Blastocatellia bacterium]